MGVVVHREEGLVVESNDVVETRDWLLVPPLVVEAPAVLNPDDLPGLCPLRSVHGERLAPGSSLNS
jgi:hypothetical protein